VALFDCQFSTPTRQWALDKHLLSIHQIPRDEEMLITPRIRGAFPGIARDEPLTFPQLESGPILIWWVGGLPEHPKEMIDQPGAGSFFSRILLRELKSPIEGTYYDWIVRAQRWAESRRSDFLLLDEREAIRLVGTFAGQGPLQEPLMATSAGGLSLGLLLSDSLKSRPNLDLAIETATKIPGLFEQPLDRLTLGALYVRRAELCRAAVPDEEAQRIASDLSYAANSLDLNPDKLQIAAVDLDVFVHFRTTALTMLSGPSQAFDFLLQQIRRFPDELSTKDVLDRLLALMKGAYEQDADRLIHARFAGLAAPHGRAVTLADLNDRVFVLPVKVQR
jgi:hypothetical protein